MLRYVISCWKSLRSVLDGGWIQEKVERNPSYNSAVKFSDEYQPSADSDYKWVLDYAVREYEMASLRLESLDGKADTLIGYLGAGAGLVSIGIAYSTGQHKSSVLVAAIPALLLLLFAILLALVARLPSKFPSPPHAKDALEYANKEKTQQAVGKFAACVWTSTRSLSLSAREKARLVRWAYRSFGAGITWLILASIISALGH